MDIYSNNVKHSTFAKAGDTIFLNITASEKIDLPAVTIANDTAYVAIFLGEEVHYLYKSADMYNATITVVSSDIQGNVSFLIVYEDPAGNKGISSQVTSQGSYSGYVVIGKMA